MGNLIEKLQPDRQLRKRINTAERILVPKGENRPLVKNWFEECGMEVPQFPGRCLHFNRSTLCARP